MMAKQVLIALDQMVNALCGGWADETISARAYRCGWATRTKIINALFFDRAHCEDSYLSEKFRRQLPPAYRVG